MKSLINKNLNIIIAICGLINAIIVFIFEIPCPWKKNFNIDCAGCGVTRMFKAIFSLKIYQAFRFNPLMFSLLVITIIYIIYYLISKLLKKDYYKISDKELLILLIVVIVFSILRNIPMFYFLKPTLVN